MLLHIRSEIQCNTIQYKTIHYNTIQNNTIQNNTIQHVLKLFASSGIYSYRFRQFAKKSDFAILSNRRFKNKTAVKIAITYKFKLRNLHLWSLIFDLIFAQ